MLLNIIPTIHYEKSLSWSRIKNISVNYILSAPNQVS